MVSSEVQRTLVKSPPELWAELSDPASLARHLSALGEVRITHVELEERVEWEAEKTTGAVSIKPSGWGTKVTIRVTREMEMLSLPPTAAAEADTASAPEAEVIAAAEHEPRATAVAEPEPEAIAAPDPAPEPEPEASLEPVPEPGPEPSLEPPTESEPDPRAAAEPAEQPARTPRRGFFARLFGRRGSQSAAPRATAAAIAAEPVMSVEIHEQSAQPGAAEPPIGAAVPAPDAIVVPPEVAELLVSAVTAQAAPRPAATDAEESAAREPAAAERTGTPDLAAELLAAEEEVTAVLTAVLDRLGAAHHRPFSRS